MRRERQRLRKRIKTAIANEESVGSRIRGEYEREICELRTELGRQRYNRPVRWEGVKSVAFERETEEVPTVKLALVAKRMHYDRRMLRSFSNEMRAIERDVAQELVTYMLNQNVISMDIAHKCSDPFTLVYDFGVYVGKPVAKKDYYD